MPLTAAEQRARRLAEQRRRVSSAQRVDQRSRVSSAQHAARRDDSDSDGADDAFAAEPNEGARSPVASPGGGAGGSRSDSGGIDSDSDDGADDSDGHAAACSAVYGSAVLRHCQRALPARRWRARIDLSRSRT